MRVIRVEERSPIPLESHSALLYPAARMALDETFGCIGRSNNRRLETEFGKSCRCHGTDGCEARFAEVVAE